MPVSVFTVYATQNDNLEIDKEVISPKLILDEKSDIKDVSVYKILDGSEYDKDAFGFISYTDAFKDNIAKDYLEVDDFYNKLLDLFNDAKELEKANKNPEKEITKDDINKKSLQLITLLMQ